jgi:tRNA threonylcarbamoyladenosine biosynthesis protein TsaB
MARILAIETATKVCSVAVSEGGSILGESTLTVPQVHVERLVLMVNELLGNLRMKYGDLDAVGVSNGPGSFTGLRIGLSVAKGIAFARDKKVIAVPTLDAIARKLRFMEDGKVIVPILHARGEEFYYARFVIYDSALRREGDYSIADDEMIAEEFDADATFVGEGVGAFAGSERAMKKFGQDSMRDLPASAAETAVLAEDKFEKGEFAELSSLVPLYIKDFVAIKGNPLNKLSRPASGPEES